MEMTEPMKRDMHGSINTQLSFSFAKEFIIVIGDYFLIGKVFGV